jgi:hypothetical protein
LAGDKIFYDYGEHHVSSLGKKPQNGNSGEQKKSVRGQPYIKPETPAKNNYMSLTVAESKKKPGPRLSAQEIRQSASRAVNYGMQGLLTIYSFDIATGVRLANTLFELRSEDGQVQQQKTSPTGTARFAVQPGRRFVLREKASPDGYALNDTEYVVTASQNGQVKVNGRSVSQLVIPAVKGQSIAIEAEEEVAEEEYEEPSVPEFSTFYPQIREKSEFITYGASGEAGNAEGNKS